MENFQKLLDEFSATLSRDVRDNYFTRWGGKHENLAEKYSRVELQPGKKYIRVVLDTSSRYFIEKETGNIYGSAGWRSPNFKRQYGTLNTVNDWYWGDFYAENKTGQDTLVPRELRKR
jgi:hypothetical protein